METVSEDVHHDLFPSIGTSLFTLSFRELQDNNELAEIGQLRPSTGPLLKPAPASVRTLHHEMPLAVKGPLHDTGLPDVSVQLHLPGGFQTLQAF
jgi:hypothetical protein